MSSRTGEVMAVLIHSGVAMDGFVGMGRGAFKEEDKSDESSSIGEVDSSGSLSESSDGGGDEEEVQSELREDDSLGSLADIEDSLPTKRGLSNFFNGKTKSFSRLADVVTAPTAVADLAKQEHPFNKRRRILMAAKKKAVWPRRASCSSLSTLPMPSLLASELLVLEEEDEDGDNGNIDDSSRLPPLPIISGKGGIKSFRSQRSFSLIDLQQHDKFS